MCRACVSQKQQPQLVSPCGAVLELLRGCVTSALGSTFRLQQGSRRVVAFQLLTGTGSFSRKNGSLPAAGMEEVVFYMRGRQRRDGDSFSQSRGDRALPCQQLCEHRRVELRPCSGTPNRAERGGRLRSLPKSRGEALCLQEACFVWTR